MPQTQSEPLAYRMCPRTLEEFAGQKHILAEGKLLYRMIKADRLSSVIFWGPPGTGKTSLARLIAATTKTDFRRINAVSSGIADIKQIAVDGASLLRELTEQYGGNYRFEYSPENFTGTVIWKESMPGNTQAFWSVKIGKSLKRISRQNKKRNRKNLWIQL